MITAPGSDAADPRWLSVAVSTPSRLTDWAWAAEAGTGRGMVVRTVRGPKMRTTAALADELSAALQFPWYFGGNFNAIEECLTDLDWLHGSAYTLIIADADALLADADAGDLDAFLALLGRVHALWARGGDPAGAGTAPVPFDVVLHAQPEAAAALAKRLAMARLKPSALPMP